MYCHQRPQKLMTSLIRCEQCDTDCAPKHWRYVSAEPLVSLILIIFWTALLTGNHIVLCQNFGVMACQSSFMTGNECARIKYPHSLSCTNTASASYIAFNEIWPSGTQTGCMLEPRRLTHILRLQYKPRNVLHKHIIEVMRRNFRHLHCQNAEANLSDVPQ